MEDLSKYRLNSYEEITALQAVDNEFTAYIDKVFQNLEALNPGESLSVVELVRPSNREKFIKIGCLFIASNKQYEFSNDYTEIHRNAQHPRDIIDQIKNKKNELEAAKGKSAEAIERA